MSPSVNGITASNAKRALLREVAQVRAGYPFRSAIEESTRGTLAVQLKDIRQGDVLDWSETIKTELSRSATAEERLRPGDILFVFRGTHNFAVLVDTVPGPAVASTQFMMLRVGKPETLLPGFLAWQINQPPAQEYFRTAAEGTAQRSLRRAVIEALEVVVPPLEFQHSVVELASLVRRERALAARLVQIREQQLNHLAASLATIAAIEPG
jgi:restriction endonuclease S subunit